MGLSPVQNPRSTIGDKMTTANARRIKNSAIDVELRIEEDFIDVEILGSMYTLRKKFKRLKFLRLLSNDPGAALELVFTPESLERLENQDMSEKDLEQVFEEVSNALVGTKN